jgi:hypothetical protein
MSAIRKLPPAGDWPDLIKKINEIIDRVNEDSLLEVQERIRLKMHEAHTDTTPERNTFADGFFNGLASALDEFRR